jgi:hypothetical protein
MPNHVHLLLETGQVPLAPFMQGVQQSYTQYFNRRYDQVGHLFQGRYQAIVCEKDRYLLALVRYIHVNPVRAQLVRQPEEYPYSGHAVHLRGQATELIDPTAVIGLLGGRGAYRRFVQEGMGEGFRVEYYKVADQQVLGGAGFAESLQRREKESPTPPAKRSLGQALKTLAKHLDTTPALLRSPDRSWEVSRGRTLLAYTLVRRLGFPLTVVAAHLGRDAATVSTLLSRLADRMQGDPEIRGEVDQLTKIV